VVLFIVMFVIGVFHGWSALLAFPIIVVGGVNFAALSLLFASRVNEFEHFQFFFAVLFPMVFLCGTYFPLNRLPEAFQYVLWAIPLTSVVDVIRSLVSGQGTPLFFLKISYVIFTTLLLLEIALRSLADRLID
jgi:ABC-type polysaccharide/polyol phosphate export permease